MSVPQSVPPFSRRALVGVLSALFAAAGLGAPAAEASPNFPDEIRLHLDSTPIPACTACHDNILGGFDTVTRPHGEAMMAAGLFADDVPSLQSALDALEADGTDSDGGGVTDVEELRDGTDPNDPADDGAPAGIGPVRYGIGCAQAGASLPLMAGLALGLLLARRRRDGSVR